MQAIFFFQEENGFDLNLFCYSLLSPALKIVLMFEVLMTVFKSLDFSELIKHSRMIEEYSIYVLSTFYWVQQL